MRRRFMLLVIVLSVPALALAFSSGGSAVRAAGSTLYVTTTGSDANPCTQAAPCATMQHAVDTAIAGDIVDVESGTYHQTVNITKPLSLVGDGPSSTHIDGSNIDTGALGYFGVVSVENNPGPGGAIRIKGFSVSGSFVTALEASQFQSPIDVVIYADQNAADNISVSNMLLGPVQNPAAFGGIGFDTFNDVAPVSFTDSTSTGNFQGALLEGGGLGGKVTVNDVNFTKLVPCGGGVNGCSGSTTVFAPEGLFVLSDQPGTANATISDNTFNNYAGDGIDADAGYALGNCAPPHGPCTGSVKITEANNSFHLGACTVSQGCAAIFLDAKSGNMLTAVLKNNKGTVHSPDKAIFQKPDSGIYNVTKTNNHIKVV